MICLGSGNPDFEKCSDFELLFFYINFMLGPKSGTTFLWVRVTFALSGNGIASVNLLGMKIMVWDEETLRFSLGDVPWDLDYKERR